jgi:hypothetical protein
MRVQGVTSTAGEARDEMAHPRPDDERKPPAVTRFGD